ncbi:MAG: hypothetical protein ACRD1Y_01280, partial [Terriglobales bacterium]
YFGEVTYLDYRPSVGAYEFGYIEPDVSDNNFIYATGGGSALNRYDWKTRQIFDISAPSVLDGLRLRYATSPQAQSPADPQALYLGAQAVLETKDRGLRWQAISPDLTGGGRAALTAVAPSPAQPGAIWAGTSDGRIEVTLDGQKWSNVTPAAVPPGTPIEMIEASPGTGPHAATTAYAVFERHTHNDFAPYIYRTRDGGQHWTRITDGIPVGDFVRVVRADPKQPGLLFAGTEHGVFVSFNDGAAWESLQLRMPRSSVRDMVDYANDLIICTYGRAMWILDDLSPLRALARHPGDTATRLFAPETAIRVQPDVNYDTPFPPEMPTGTNPPAGAILNYYLAAPASKVTLSVYDSAGHLVRRLTSTTMDGRGAPQPPPQLAIPNYWLARPHPLPTGAGMHRVSWDLRYTAPPAFSHTQPIAALLHNTPSDPRGPFVTAGQYELRLEVDGATYRQPLTVTMDPQITVPLAGLEQQRDLGLAIAAAMRASYEAAGQLSGGARNGLSAAERKQLQALGASGRRRFGRFRRAAPAGPASFRQLNGGLGRLLTLIELSDDAPTPTMEGNYQRLCRQLQQSLAVWRGLSANPATAPAASCAGH